MVTKICKFHNVSPFCQFYKKVVLPLNEHDDVIETQTIKICPLQSFLANSVPDYSHTYTDSPSFIKFFF